MMSSNSRNVEGGPSPLSATETWRQEKRTEKEKKVKLKNIVEMRLVPVLLSRCVSEGSF